MSYCRFSSDNWKCDVYVYVSVGDYFAIHVAHNRIVGDIPSVPPLSGLNPDDKQAVNAWIEANQEQMAWLDTCERVPITLPHAGESLQAPDAEECADKLEYLRGLGYIVPQRVIDSLREEAKDASGPQKEETR